MHELFTLDLTPEFLAASIKIGDGIVCAVSPGVFETETVQHALRELARRHGSPVAAVRSSSKPNGTAQAAA